MTQILVVKPKTLNAIDKRKLRSAGIVTVEAERPQDVRLIGPEGASISGNDLAFAAVRALAETSGAYSDCKDLFVTIMGQIVIENREREQLVTRPGIPGENGEKL